jgi:hypothetical protein
MAELGGREGRGWHWQAPLSGALRRIMKQEAAGIIWCLLSSIKRTKGNLKKDIQIQSHPSQVLAG